MTPSYIESPRPGPTSPQMICRPRCIMKPVIEPASPRTITVPPFWSIPVRAPTRPLTSRSPPRIAAAARRRRQRAGVRLDHDDPGHHVLAGRPADAALDRDLRPVDQPAAEVAEAPVEGDPAAG